MRIKMKRKRFNFLINNDDEKIIMDLKKKYHINISDLIRDLIKQYYDNIKARSK
jgi:hypothetical protein